MEKAFEPTTRAEDTGRKKHHKQRKHSKLARKLAHKHIEEEQQWVHMAQSQIDRNDMSNLTVPTTNSQIKKPI